MSFKYFTIFANFSVSLPFFATIVPSQKNQQSSKNHDFIFLAEIHSRLQF